jgi:hypothetical protein
MGSRAILSATLMGVFGREEWRETEEIGDGAESYGATGTRLGPASSGWLPLGVEDVCLLFAR